MSSTAYQVDALLDALPPELRNAVTLRIVQGDVKDKTYRSFPIGQEAGRYLRQKRKRLTPTSYRDYEACLDKLARDHRTLELKDLEPPKGIEILEEFLDVRWGHQAPRTYNKNHSILSDFFNWALLTERISGDPMRRIEKARKRAVHRTTFTADQRLAIIASQAELRDRLALRLLLDYGIRKGSLRRVQFKHFDHIRKHLTIFAKGEKIRALPIVSSAFWDDLGRHIIETSAQPHHYLLCRQKAIPRVKDGQRFSSTHRFPEQPMGDHGLHDWWYRCLATAGVVGEGTTSGERMHKARHTSGQRVLDATGNLKAVQKLLGHASIQTTGDTYTDWDIDQLTVTLREALGDDA